MWPFFQISQMIKQDSATPCLLLIIHINFFSVHLSIFWMWSPLHNPDLSQYLYPYVTSYCYKAWSVDENWRSNFSCILQPVRSSSHHKKSGMKLIKIFMHTYAFVKTNANFPHNELCNLTFFFQWIFWMIKS